MKNATDAHLILDAVQFATEVDLSSLRQLAAQRPEPFSPELVLRIILTFLPEHVDPASYVDLVRDVALGNLNALDTTANVPQPSKVLSEDQARKRVRKLRLLPLHHPSLEGEDASLLTRFVVARAYYIDSETGSLSFLRDLVQSFLSDAPTLELWALTSVYPLLRLELDSGLGSACTLETFGALRGLQGLEELLDRTIGHGIQSTHDYDWLLREIVGPWMEGQRRRMRLAAGATQRDDKIRGLYEHLNRRILEIARHRFQDARQIFEQWNGPSDMDLEERVHDLDRQEDLSIATIDYAQACLACVYISPEPLKPEWPGIQSLLVKAAKLSRLTLGHELDTSDKSKEQRPLPTGFVSSLSRVHVLPAELLEASNALTRPSAEALELGFRILVSITTLGALGQRLSMSEGLSLGLFGTESDQRSVLSNILHHSVGTNMKDTDWSSVRDDLRWLHNWNVSDSSGGAVWVAPLGRIGQGELDMEFLKAILADSRFVLVGDMFCLPGQGSLPIAKVEAAILEAGLKMYDSASNGNKSRGGMKKTSQLVDAFAPRFPASTGLKQLAALVQATHALSFYSLTLQRGVPLLPANIRAHASPLALVDRVLEQNPKSYTKLNDLLGIGRNLVRAGLVKHKSSDGATEARTISSVERSIKASTIRAALAECDFDTAYAYISNRLSAGQESEQADDVLWQAAFEAGRYRSRTGSSPADIRRLEQKMELLSRALVLAPITSIPEVLEAWREAEEMVNAALSTETEEEGTWRHKGRKKVPGAFVNDDSTGPQARHESPRASAADGAPMGLFDVARGAAAALQKSAFPLQGAQNVLISTRGGGNEGDQASNEAGRIRKRDMVSNMVTGGLTSGIGWVLGKCACGLYSTSSLTLHRGTASEGTRIIGMVIPKVIRIAWVAGASKSIVICYSNFPAVQITQCPYRCFQTLVIHQFSAA